MGSRAAPSYRTLQRPEYCRLQIGAKARPRTGTADPPQRVGPSGPLRYTMLRARMSGGPQTIGGPGRIPVAGRIKSSGRIGGQRHVTRNGCRSVVCHETDETVI